MAMLDAIGPVYCPKCPESWMEGKRSKIRTNAPLEVIRENYSGSGVDIVKCLDCGRKFQVSYKVAEVMEIDDQGRPRR